MPRCSNCDRELPGFETLCQQCFEAGYDRLAHPKPWWQRFQLRPQFARDNFIGFFLLFALAFVRLRFDLTTETSALISSLFACVAFFHEGRAKSQSIVASSSSGTRNLGDGRPAYARLLLMILGEAIAGTLLYGCFTVIPLALQMLITIGSWAVVWIEIGTFPKNKSIGSLLSALTGVATFCCGIAWRVTDQEVWSRLMLVGGCLMAALIFLDRRQEWMDLA
jgi:hypothetical protein